MLNNQYKIENKLLAAYFISNCSSKTLRLDTLHAYRGLTVRDRFFQMQHVGVRTVVSVTLNA